MSASSVEFLDTNILIYAYDTKSPRKRPVAFQLLTRLDASMGGALSIQVLSEFYSVFTRKLGHTQENAEAVLRDFSPWLIHSPIHEDLIRASQLARRYGLSWWDAVLVNSAIQVGATTLWSEDLQSGQQFGPLVIRNPFTP